MRNYSVILILALLTGGAIAWGAKPTDDSSSESSSAIRLNSLGFLPDANKSAAVIQSCSEFTVKKADDGNTVYTGKITVSSHQQDVDQTAWVADFTEVNKPGRYYLDVPGVGRSYVFDIGENVYDAAFYTAMRGFYLWRCGTAVEGTYNGVHYACPACHMEDGWLDYAGQKDTRRDGTGGWHDAGDYGKYVVNAGMTVGTLFLAWEMFGDRIKTVSLDIPDATKDDWPDFLKELKWETDWLLKMQYPDGSGKVSHKLTALNFEGVIMPQDDKAKRYFTEWSTEATADFVAVMAMAARLFKPCDVKYAQQCLDAATLGYKCLQENPAHKEADIAAFHTGGYTSPDEDDRLWASAEMWETTGQAQYLKDFESRAAAIQNKVDTTWGWDNVKNLGIFTYLLSKRAGRDDAIVMAARQDLITAADAIVTIAKADVYGRSMGGHYYWGCNGALAAQAVVLQMANAISPNKDYAQTSLAVVGHLFGKNYYGRSYVTGLGHLPPMNPHDRRSWADGIEPPLPGYLVGGGHSATGWEDVAKSFRTNEIAINWNATLVFALAGFTSSPSH